MTIKILLIEDHPLVADGVARVLTQIEEEDVDVLSALNFAQAVHLLNHHIDAIELVLLDLDLPDMDGFECLQVLRRDYRDLPVAILSGTYGIESIDRAFALGASGYIPKTYLPQQIINAVCKVLAGDLYHPEIKPAPKSLPTNFADFVATHNLTGRQEDVLARILQGQSNREIAAALALTEGTIKVHVTTLFKTLGVNSRTKAMCLVQEFMR